MFRSRLAPTPSGFIHFGNLLNFTKTWLIIRALGGELHLRIDDLDSVRYRRKYAKDIFESLDWLGISYDTGPRNVEELEKVHSQQHRLGRYREALEELKSKGHLYACDCSRKKITSYSEDHLYPGWCREKNLSFEGNVAWRIALPPALSIAIPDLFEEKPFELTLPASMPDFILQTKANRPSYQIASLMDDVDLDIQIIIRGTDLLPSTAAQLHLSELLNLSFHKKVLFHHHPLLHDQQGQKLSKTAGNSEWKGLSTSGMRSGEVIQRIFEAMNLDDPGVNKLSDIKEPAQYLPAFRVPFFGS